MNSRDADPLTVTEAFDSGFEAGLRATPHWRRIAAAVTGAFIAGLLIGRLIVPVSAAPRGPQENRMGDAAGRTLAGAAGAAPVVPGAPSDGPGSRVRATPAGTPSPTPTARAVPRPSGPVSRGTASYCAPTPRYCGGWGGGAHLAAVRSFRFGDRPYTVTVCRADDPGRCTTARVVSFCACGTHLVDLSPSAFAELAPLSRGVVNVVVRGLR